MLTKRPASLIAAAVAIVGALTLAGCTGTQPPVSSPTARASVYAAAIHSRVEDDIARIGCDVDDSLQEPLRLRRIERNSVRKELLDLCL